MGSVKFCDDQYLKMYSFEKFCQPQIGCEQFSSWDETFAIVSQPSECLKFMTFREGCFVIRN